MTVGAFAEQFRLPSVRKLLYRAADELAEGRSVLLIAPPSVAVDGLGDALRTVLQQRSFHQREIWLPSIPQDHTLAASLGESLRVSWPSPEAPRTVANLAAAENLPDIVWLDGMSDVAPPQQEEWISFIRQWATHTRTRLDAGQSITRLVSILPASSCGSVAPQSDSHLAVVFWWGYPSRLEAQLLCRLLTDDPGASAATWRERVLPALAGNDAALIDYLWESVCASQGELLERLQEYASARGWGEASLASWGAGSLDGLLSVRAGMPMSSPPPSTWELWAHGCLGWTEEYGLELHVAVLAALGRTTEVNHRIWRGQAELLLPLLDQVRLTLCKGLTEHYGRDWPVRWIRPIASEEDEAVRREPLACQWGHLDRVVSERRSRRYEASWQPVVSLARYLRNEMAHYRPIAYEEYDALLQRLALVRG